MGFSFSTSYLYLCDKIRLPICRSWWLYPCIEREREACKNFIHFYYVRAKRGRICPAVCMYGGVELSTLCSTEELGGRISTNRPGLWGNITGKTTDYSLIQRQKVISRGCARPRVPWKRLQRIYITSAIFLSKRRLGIFFSRRSKRRLQTPRDLEIPTENNLKLVAWLLVGLLNSISSTTHMTDLNQFTISSANCLSWIIFWVAVVYLFQSGSLHVSR